MDLGKLQSLTALDIEMEHCIPVNGAVEEVALDLTPLSASICRLRLTELSLDFDRCTLAGPSRVIASIQTTVMTRLNLNFAGDPSDYNSQRADISQDLDILFAPA